MNESAVVTPAQLAKAALRRLAVAKLEPTPENYAKAWAEESGAATAGSGPKARRVFEQVAARLVEDPAQRGGLVTHLLEGHWDEALRQLAGAGAAAAEQSKSWAGLIDRLARGLERGGRQWTTARKKDSLQRVLGSSGSDQQRLQHRLRQLVSSWETDRELPPEEPAPEQDTSHEAPGVAPVQEGADPAAHAAQAPGASPGPTAVASHSPPPDAEPAPPPSQPYTAAADWAGVVQPLARTLAAALPADGERALALADELAAWSARLGEEGLSPALAQGLHDFCERAGRLLAHRHHLLAQVHQLSRELAGSLAELSEDDSWVRGQVETLQGQLDEPLSARALQAARQMLAHARERQRALRGERDLARASLKELIQRMLGELGELDQQTGAFSDGMQRYARIIESADSLESLAGVVREMVDDSRTVHSLVSSTRERLQGSHQHALALEARVRELETDLRRLSDEVATDALTQVANRRGLMMAFEKEQAALERQGGELCIGLLDIDNFKRLNDSLGHAAGDQALVALAERVQQSLRPVDSLARFGGEEFVVLLPATPAEEARKVLTRLQRLLTASLFMHQDQEVFVTFSAGVTAYRPGETIEQALERADEALYEAKRTGKNRTCIA